MGSCSSGVHLCFYCFNCAEVVWYFYICGLVWFENSLLSLDFPLRFSFTFKAWNSGRIIGRTNRSFKNHFFFAYRILSEFVCSFLEGMNKVFYLVNWTVTKIVSLQGIYQLVWKGTLCLMHLSIGKSSLEIMWTIPKAANKELAIIQFVFYGVDE